MTEKKESTTRDEVIHEVRAIKEALAREEGYDVRRILNKARENQKQSGRTILLPPAKHGVAKDVS